MKKNLIKAIFYTGIATFFLGSLQCKEKKYEWQERKYRTAIGDIPHAALEAGNNVTLNAAEPLFDAAHKTLSILPL